MPEPLWWEEFLPDHEMNPAHRRAIERAKTLTREEQIEIFREISANNPHARSILTGLIKQQLSEDLRTRLPDGDPRITPRLAALRAGGPVTDEEFDEILREIAPHEPYAQELLDLATK